MLNKYIRSTIIIMIQMILPIFGILWVASELLQSNQLLSITQQFLSSHHMDFIIGHSALFLTLFLLWPRIIKAYTSRLEDTPASSHIQTALTARWYLLTSIAIFEILVWWR